MSKSSSSSFSIGLPGIVFVVFLVLKLAEIGAVANWSWWWVTSPLWIPVGAVVGILVVVAIIWLIAQCIIKILS